MIRFLLKGLLRDKSRSRIPVIVVAIGVMLTIMLHAYIKGVMGDIVEMNARFSDGHVKVMTKVYADNISQMPNDLALLESDELTGQLEKDFPDMEWAQRIRFGGLIDVPDENGDTKTQGPTMGLGLSLLAPGTREPERLNLMKSLLRGKMPSQKGEILISEEFSEKLAVNPGDRVTLIGSTMNGSMAIYNFIISGTISFGTEVLDRGTIIADIGDVRDALDMPDASGEILGFLKTGFYNEEAALLDAEKFNASHRPGTDEFAPVMNTLSEQGSMGQYVNLSNNLANYIAAVFVFAMSLVLWNAGLLGGLRRYGEVGVRLAMGEEKRHVYMTLIYESVMIGLAGSAAGTVFGLFFSWLVQKYGIDISGLLKSTSIMMPTVLRTHITKLDFYLGFIPGLLSTVIGTMLSGIGIYRRQTARLFKELEA
ncbi:MAG: FtsX-like permease family protein [Bacteroidota bacterium]|nr:FtsX-like permease family protein [Bacteroidota bacterium]